MPANMHKFTFSPLFSSGTVSWVQLAGLENSCSWAPRSVELSPLQFPGIQLYHKLVNQVCFHF